MNINAFSPGATVSLSVTTTSAAVALSGNGSVVEVQNAGAAPIFIKLGGASVTAAATDYPVLAGTSKLITRDADSQTYIAAIAASGSSTLYATIGEGA
jgi:hypothetical protein